MYVQDLISKWIREANEELVKAKNEQNLKKMADLNAIIKKLSEMKSRL